MQYTLIKSEFFEFIAIADEKSNFICRISYQDFETNELAEETAEKIKDLLNDNPL